MLQALATQASATPASPNSAVEVVPTTPTAGTAGAELSEVLHTPHTQAIVSVASNGHGQAATAPSTQPLFHLPQSTVDDIKRLKFPATIQALLHITISTAVAMNNTFSFPASTAYRAAKYQRVFDLSMPGRPSPVTVRHGVTL